jgi:hypothetical protein
VEFTPEAVDTEVPGPVIEAAAKKARAPRKRSAKA